MMAAVPSFLSGPNRLRRRRGPVALVGCAGMLVAGCSSSGPSTPTAPSPRATTLAAPTRVLHTVARENFGDWVTAELKGVDSAEAGYFDAQRAVFETALGPYRARLSAIREKFAGTSVASTESIFVYLGDYLGLKIVSPPEFMQAVAEGN